MLIVVLTIHAAHVIIVTASALSGKGDVSPLHESNGLFNWNHNYTGTFGLPINLGLILWDTHYTYSFSHTHAHTSNHVPKRGLTYTQACMCRTAYLFSLLFFSWHPIFISFFSSSLFRSLPSSPIIFFPYFLSPFLYLFPFLSPYNISLSLPFLYSFICPSPFSLS